MLFFATNSPLNFEQKTFEWKLLYFGPILSTHHETRTGEWVGLFSRLVILHVIVSFFLVFGNLE